MASPGALWEAAACPKPSADRAVTLAPYDVPGRRVAALYRGRVGPAAPLAVVPPSGQPSGAYVPRAGGAAPVQTRRVVVRRRPPRPASA